MNLFKSFENLGRSQYASLFLPIAEEHVMQVAQAVAADQIAVAVKADPEATEQELIDAVDGSIWHFTRLRLGVLGFAVDIARNEPQIDGKVRDLISAELAASAVQEKPDPNLQVGG